MAEIVALSRTKRRSIFSPLERLSRKAVSAVRTIIYPLFRFAGDHGGAVLRRQTTLLVKIVGGVLHLLRVIDNVKSVEANGEIITWLENEEFPNHGSMSVGLAGRKIFFLSIGGREVERNETRFVWSLDEQKRLAGEMMDAMTGQVQSTA